LKAINLLLELGYVQILADFLDHGASIVELQPNLLQLVA
jgi:hypothetical protein